MKAILSISSLPKNSMGVGSSTPQPPRQLPNFGVSVKGNQKAEKEGIDNEIGGNKFVTAPQANVGVDVGGDQVAGTGIKNKVSGNTFGYPPSGAPPTNNGNGA